MRTPAFHDYHFVAAGGLDDRFGAGFTDRLQTALLGIDGSTGQQLQILDLFGAQSFIKTDHAEYENIEAVGRAIGVIQV